MVLETVLLVVFYFIAVPLIVHLIYKYVFKQPDQLLPALMSVLVSMVTFIVASFVFYSQGEYELYDTRSIVALQDSETFVVSRYSADSEIYYYYMQKIGDAYYPKQAKQNLSTIRYIDEKPIVKVYRLESPNRIVEFLSYSSGMIGIYEYEFYLPEGTVKEEFSIDMK